MKYNGPDEKHGQECCMSKRVGSRGPYSMRRNRVLYGALRPHTECFITHTAHTVRAITNFSSVKHKTVLYDKGNSAV